MKIISSLLLIFLFCCQVSIDPAQEQKRTIFYDNSPLDNGSLVIVGGGMRDSLIFEKFLALAGGKNAPLVIIVAAMADTVSSEMIDRTRDYFSGLGATNFTILHTKDQEVANSDEFVNPIREAKGIWFTGGRQWRIVDSYQGTLAQLEFENVLKRGGVIGGTSAGATIQGSYLARGDTKTNEIMMGDHEEGFGYLKNTAIDQHVLRRNRQHDLVEIISARPELLGIGIDENTALVVQGETFEVIGSSYVAIYDTQRWKEYAAHDSLALPNNGRFYLLRPGDVYDFVKREFVTGSERF